MKYLKNFETMTAKDKDEEMFNYSSQINSLWYPVINDAKKFQNINFDLENNDSTKEKKQ